MAPHRVTDSGAYYGRGDTTRHKLTDAEIARLHARRTVRYATAEQLCDEAERRLNPANLAAHAHTVVAVRPLPSPPDLLTQRFSEDHQLLRRIRDIAEAVPQAGSIGIGWEYLNRRIGTPSGVAAQSAEYTALSNGQGAQVKESNAMRLELHDDGTVEFFLRRRLETHPRS